MRSSNMEIPEGCKSIVCTWIFPRISWCGPMLNICARSSVTSFPMLLNILQTIPRFLSRLADMTMLPRRCMLNRRYVLVCKTLVLAFPLLIFLYYLVNLCGFNVTFQARCEELVWASTLRNNL